MCWPYRACSVMAGGLNLAEPWPWPENGANPPCWVHPRLLSWDTSQVARPVTILIKLDRGRLCPKSC